MDVDFGLFSINGVYGVSCLEACVLYSVRDYISSFWMLNYLLSLGEFLRSFLISKSLIFSHWSVESVVNV